MRGPRLIRVMTQNMGPSMEGDGVEALRELVAQTRPQLLLVQQVVGLSSQKRLRAFGECLGMQVVVGEIRGGRGGAIVVGWDPGWMELDGFEVTDGLGPADGFGYVAAHLKVVGWKYVEKLTAVSCHLSRSSAPLAAQQVQVLGDLVHRDGGLGVIGGGINHLPVGDEEPNWASVPPFRRMALCRAPTAGDATLVGDDLVGRTLAVGGFADVAARIADRGVIEHPELRAPTVNLPGAIRGDQVHVTSALASTIETCTRLEALAGGHRGLAADLDLAKVDINGRHAYV